MIKLLKSTMESKQRCFERDMQSLKNELLSWKNDFTKLQRQKAECESLIVTYQNARDKLEYSNKELESKLKESLQNNIDNLLKPENENEPHFEELDPNVIKKTKFFSKY
eukprot:UN27648